MFSYLHLTKTMLSLTYSFNRSYTAFFPSRFGFCLQIHALRSVGLLLFILLVKCT